MRNFFNVLIDILLIILPSLLTGLVTFWVTIYKYNKNKPLDKLEITYNRVIYPVYKKIIENEDNKNIDLILEEIKYYFLKNIKYIDIPTMRAFNDLYNEKKERKKKSKYKSFKANIVDQNQIFRRALGYFSPNVDRVYRYSEPTVKIGYAIFIELSFMYSCILFSTIPDEGTIWYTFLIRAAATLIIVMVVQIIILIVRKIYYWIK